MSAPTKFDFSSYPAAIPAIPAIQGQDRNAFSVHDICDSCDSAIPGHETRLRIAEIAGIAEGYDDFQDDRRHCRECRNLRNGYCTAQRFRPVDDMPRRCDDFTGYPVSTPTTVSNTQVEGLILFKETSQPGTLLVTVYTPSGTPMTIRADDAEHADWLRRMNPKPANANPANFANPEPDAARISEAEHNAQGRYFKFLATWPDGSECYLCQMPRMTLAEMLAQYPTATKIEPVMGEEPR